MKIVRILFPLVLILGLGYLVFAQLNENKKIIDEQSAPRKEVVIEVPVTTQKVSTTMLMDSLVINGTFQAKKELTVVAESSGRITQLLVEEGQYVSRGQTIARIDDSSIRAQLSTINAQLEKAKNDVASFERLLKAGAVSQQQFEEMKLGRKNIEASLAAVEQQLEYTILKNPMPGVIQSLPVEEGSFVAPGSPVATVVDISSLKMTVQVPEKDVVKLKRGQKVKIKTDVYPDKTFQGTITLIAVQADAARKFNVEVELPVTSQYPLKPGMFGTVSIQTSTEPVETIFIQRKAIAGSIQSPTVYVVRNGKAEYRPIFIARLMGDQVEITEGLEEGEEVILTGQINLTDGSPVRVTTGTSIDKVDMTREVENISE